MSKARNLSDLLDANGDVVSGSLDNVPPADVVNDTTPQLGGNLDLNGSDITGTGNVNVTGTITATNFVGSDLVNDTTPQLGGALDTNGNDINFGDNDNANFGAGNDLTIYHNSATGESFIEESGTGNLYVRGTNLRLQDTLGANYFSAQSGGESYLYHNGLQRVQVNTSGIDVTGTVTATSFSGSGANLTGVPTGDFYFDSSSNIFYMSSAGTDSYTNIGASNNSYKSFTVPAGGMAVVSAQNRDMYLSARNNTNLRLNGNSFSGNPATHVSDGNAVVVVNIGSSSQYFTVGLSSAGYLQCGSMGLS